MKTSKKLLVIALALVLTVLSLIAPTFSWYNHSDSEEGNFIRYNTTDLPVSSKSLAGDISYTNTECDVNGEVAANAAAVNTIILAENNGKAVKYYKTTFGNSGSNDVYIDYGVSNFPNNADFYIGTLSPTLNEKAYASRATRSKKADTTTRIYFKAHSSMSSYWSEDNYNKNLLPEKGTYYYNINNELTEYTSNNNAAGSSYQQGNNGTYNDINLSYTVDGKEFQVRMLKCPDDESNNTLNNLTHTAKVFYYDLPSNTEKFFFFNHWYLRSASNREWNRTLDITDLTPGRLYYMTGGNIDGKEKEYKVREVNMNLAAVHSYYDSVRMSMGTGVFADIGLKKESTTEDEDFVPDYYGVEVKYTSSDTSKATVNTDGIITPIESTGNNPITITTRVKGTFGDYIERYTSLSIPASISEVPVIKNVKVPAGETVEIYWYALNKSSDTPFSTGNLYYTL